MSGFDAPLLLALAIDDPDREAQLLHLVHDPAFTVDGRPCEVARVCASVRDLEEVVSSGAVDAAIVASQLGAIPFANLVALARRPTRMVIIAPDAADGRWDDFPGGLVLGPAPTPELLTFALAGDRAAVAGWRGRQAPRNRSTSSGGRDARSAHADQPRKEKQDNRRPRGRVISVAGAYERSGRTMTAIGLARAFGVRHRTALVDADMRMGTTPFTLGLSAGHSVCHLAEKHLASAEAWDAALEAELQSLGDASQTVVLAGVHRPSMRPRLTPAFYEHLVQALAERFAYVVIDTAGTGWSAADSPIDGVSLRLADQILLVIRPDVQGVALAREALREWPTGRERIGLALNDLGERGQQPESRAEIEVVLGLGVVAVIPFDPKGVHGANRRRRPIVCQRGARAAARLLDLAARIDGGGPIVLPPDVEPAATTSAWWRRLDPNRMGGLLRW
jgi:Mrp family chromosome partitioning ATPase